VKYNFIKTRQSTHFVSGPPSASRSTETKKPAELKNQPNSAGMGKPAELDKIAKPAELEQKTNTLI